MDFWNELLDSVPGEAFLEHNGCPACPDKVAGASPEAGAPKPSDRELGRLGPTLLKSCGACGLVYTSPRLSASVRDGMYRKNPGAMTPELDGILERLMDDRMRNMRREMFLSGETPDSLFEVGSGWGHFLNAGRKHFAKVTGVELSKEQSEHSRRRFGLQISEEDIFSDGKPARYDMIAAWELLEHLPEPRRFLSWALEHLRPGGQLALSTPNFNSLYRRILGPRWFYFIPSQHLTYFSPRTLKALLLEVGFSDVKIFTSGRSLFRERRNGHNRIDLNLDARGQWLQTLRIRDSVERQRDETVLDKKNPLKRIWHGAMWRLINPLLTRGLGDQMRVYARKSR